MMFAIHTAYILDPFVKHCLHFLRLQQASPGRGASFWDLGPKFELPARRTPDRSPASPILKSAETWELLSLAEEDSHKR